MKQIKDALIISLIGILFLSGCTHEPHHNVSDKKRNPSEADYDSEGHMILPKVLFHASSKTILSKNIEAHEISKADWDKYIMPVENKGANFGLPPFRKGLYGATRMADVSLYALYKILAGQEPDIMVVHVDNSCYTKEAIFNSNYQLDPVSESNSFSLWVQKNRQRLGNLPSLCQSPSSTAQYKYWEEGELYSDSKKFPEDKKKCIDVLNQFLVETNIKAVEDKVNDSSWYLRDLACIKDISGGYDQLLTMILKNQIGPSESSPIENLFGGDAIAPGKFYAGNQFIFLRSLAKSTLVNDSILPDLAILHKNIQEWLSQDKKPKTISLDSNYDNYWIYKQALLSVSGAIKKKKVAEFQQQLNQVLDQILVHTKARCPGTHGVDPEHQVQCHEDAEKSGQKLMSVLEKFI